VRAVMRQLYQKVLEWSDGQPALAASLSAANAGA
jgi:hypothetical protein